MSINALANAAATRRLVIFPRDRVPGSLGEIAWASAKSPSVEGPEAPAPQAGKPSSQIDTALHVLFGYIPTEVLTLYVAVIAAVHPPPGDAASRMPTTAEWAAVWSFAAATPVTVWLTYAAKIKAVGKPLPVRPSAWPVWEMSAATVAYGAWAFALPDAPFSKYGWYSSALSGVAVLIASTVLGLLGPLFQRPIGTASS